MTQSRLLLGIASIFAGLTTLLVVLGAVYNLFFIAVAIPFGVTTYFLWYHATGRLGNRARARAARHQGRDRHDRQRQGTRARARARARTDGQRRRRRTESTDPSGTRTREGPNRSEASRILDVDAGADQATVRRAYRERVKDVHPDIEGGNEEEFKRVNAAYERLKGK